jgi:hypothetical protein
MLITLAIAAAVAAIVTKQRSAVGNFKRAESLLCSYLCGVIEHVRFRDCENFFLLIGGPDENSLTNLMLIENSESPTQVDGLHLSINGLGSIVGPDLAQGSNFRVTSTFDSLPGFWLMIQAKEIFEDNFHIVLRSTGQRPVFRKISVSQNGNAIAEALPRVHAN